MGKVTIREIAEAAGVSPTAVSFAFNSPERLSKETLARILRIAEEYDYSPDPVARSMTSGRTGAVGVLLANPFDEILLNPFLYEFLVGIGEVCTRADLSIKLLPPREDGFRHAVVNAAVDGIVTLGVDPSYSVMVALRQRGVPFVMVDTDPVEGIPALNIDDQKGAYGQMQHVLKAGHRRIAILGIRSGYRGRYERYIGTLRRRVAGYLAALEECSLNLDGRQVRLIESPCLAEGGRRAFRQVWNAEPRPTALVCMCDIVAIGAIGAARESGIRVPEDVSVIGFDDIAFSSLVSPPLTTVHQPLRPKGRLAAEMLIDHMNGKLGQSARVLRTRLVVRNSVAAPAQ